jgi:hypothetical protein
MLLITLLTTLTLWGCAANKRATPCSPAWNEWVEARLPSGDGMGHGPDIGSLEWQSVIEFKLGLRGDPDVPPRGSQRWCAYIDQRL